jgi:type IV secretory pathway TrbD component
VELYAKGEVDMRGTAALYFKSLNRTFTVMGVDRQIFFLIIGLCLPIAFSGRLSPSMDAISIIIFLVLYIIGVLVTRADSHILAIYRRHIHYKKYYSAVPGTHAKVLLIKASVPYYQGKGGLL